MEDNTPQIRKTCKACGASKLLKDYMKCEQCVDGYRPRCRHCISNNVQIDYDNTQRKKLWYDDNLSMRGVVKDVYIEMYKLLEEIGYDLTKPIDEQFAEKYNLTVKHRCKFKQNKYNPKDLGLI
jgi:hypothetical protein